MRKNLTKKLFLSVLTLAFAVVSLGASTYAWFTISDSAKINAFSANVKSAEGIEIAVTSTKELGSAQWYVGEVPTGIIQDVAVREDDFTFDAVTPNGFAFENQTFKDQKDLAKTGGWISFYVHIQAKEAGTVSIDQITLTSSNVQEWQVTAPFSTAAKDENDTVVGLSVKDKVEYEVANAARVALVMADNSYQVYEQGAVNAVAPSEENAGKGGNSEGFDVTNGAYEYYNKINPNDTLDAEKKATYDATPVTDLKNAQDDAVVELFDITTANTPVTFQVLVWIEGWDAECLNAIFSQGLSVELVFKFDVE